MELPIYSACIALISIVTYCLYAADKRKAKKKKWRVAEKTLLGFSFFGGAIGGLLAMLHLRHKTKHWYFYLVNILGLAWQLTALAYLVVNS